MPRASAYDRFDTLVCSVTVHLTLLFQTGYLSMPEESAATTEGISSVSVLQLLDTTTSLEKLKLCFDCSKRNWLFCKDLREVIHFL